MSPEPVSTLRSPLWVATVTSPEPVSIESVPAVEVACTSPLAVSTEMVPFTLVRVTVPMPRFRSRWAPAGTSNRTSAQAESPSPLLEMRTLRPPFPSESSLKVPSSLTRRVVS